MRPTKHATHTHTRPQEIFDVSIARLGTKKKTTTPVAATSEPDKITLFVWDETHGAWADQDINHVPIETPRGVPSFTNKWNWSRHVGLITFEETIAVVYKRIELPGANEAPGPATLTLDTFHLDGIPRRDLHLAVPMPTYTEQSTFPPVIRRVPEDPGFELWAGTDLKRRKLMIVTQTLGKNATDDGDNAQLTLLLGELDRLDQTDGWKFQHLDDGGYGLDVRHVDNTLTLAYRTEPHSLKVPLPIGSIDPFFSGVPQVELDAQANSDQFYSPLRVTTLDLETLAATTIDLPGGEHPRIQSVSPLFITVDRPRLRVRFRQTRVDGRQEPQIDWTLRGIDKLAFLLDASGRVARGVLLSFAQPDRPTFPRTSNPLVGAQDLFTGITPNGIGWASITARFPLETLRVDSDKKGLFFDFLQKSPLFALLESRARLNANFDEGVLIATDLQSVVYDVNHGQFGAPDGLLPDATGEEAQFAPFERLSESAGEILSLSPYLADNTIGGSLVTDRDGTPWQFFSYIDLGDGGLRVIFDADLGPPDEPPPIEKPKTLEPERVTGPGSGDEKWIELKADVWRDAGVPTLRVLHLVEAQPSITSSVQAQIENLLTAGETIPDPPLPSVRDDGWSEDQVNKLQSDINDSLIENGAQPRTQFSTDGTTPRAFISMSPPVVVADATTIWEAGIEGETVGDVEWRFTSPAVIVQPIVLTATGHSLPAELPLSGDWIVRANITRQDGTVRTFETVVTVEKSLFLTVATVHHEIANRELDPPLNSVGSVQIGSATIGLLQYELKFEVAEDDTAANRIFIKTLEQTDAQWRFRANGIEQGLIDYRLRIKFDSEDIRLGGLLGSLLTIERITASFFYGRSFTPGILMNDTRSVVPLSGEESSSDSLVHGNEADAVPRFASSLTARPFGDAGTMKDKVVVKVSMLPQAAAAAVVVLLTGLGAVTAATILMSLVAALGVAIAAAAAPVVGVLGAGAVIAATVAIFLFIEFAVPPIVEGVIANNVQQGLLSDDTRESLEKARLIQFAGEGVAESIARQVIKDAEIDPPPAEDPGADRFRQDLFQMIHVSEGRTRVLIRM